LYLTSGGIAATKNKLEKKSTQPRFEEDSEGEGYASDN
jgi:tRNA pseudouridine38-40 synthase